MNFGGLLENLDPALLTQIMASIQQASDQPRMRIGVDANQSEINVPQQWPPQNAQQAFSGMPQLMPQPQPQPMPQMPAPQIGILNQQAEQSPRAEARPEPKPEYNPQSPGILGKPMPEKMPTDPYAFDFKKNWPLLLLQFANGMGAGNTGRKKGQRIWGALASGATNTGNFLQQYPQQKMHEDLLRGKVDEAAQKRQRIQALSQFVAKLPDGHPFKEIAAGMEPEKFYQLYGDKMIQGYSPRPGFMSPDPSGKPQIDPTTYAAEIAKAQASRPVTNVGVTLPKAESPVGKLLNDRERLEAMNKDPNFKGDKLQLQRTISALDRQIEEEMTGKPKSTTEAAMLSAADGSEKDLLTLKKSMFNNLGPNGELTDNSSYNAARVAAQKLPNIVQGKVSSESQRAEQAIKRIVETRMRLATGATAPEPEVIRYTNMFSIKLGDSDAVARDKMRALEDFFHNTKKYLNPAPGQTTPEMRSQPTTQTPQQQPKAVQPAPEASQRQPGQVYQTPRGPMKWTGTGWLPAN